MADNTGIEWTNATWNPVTLHPERLDIPLHWKKPRMVFVNSMSDLFHEDVPDEFISAVFGVMARCPYHTFQILTKRPARMKAWIKDNRNPVHWLASAGVANPQCFKSPLGGDEAWFIGGRSPLPNVWLGVSVENQRYWWQP